MFLTTRGLVLREAKYKETDKILTLLTETDGKLTVKARGVARARSKISAASQLLTFSDFTLFGSRGRWTINEAESVEQFRGLRGISGCWPWAAISPRCWSPSARRACRSRRYCSSG